MTTNGAPDVVVVGAGATGLACAAGLGHRGVPSLVLEQGDAVGAAWRTRYRSLRLNSGRPFSQLPGRRFPRGTPMFPTRDQVVCYLQDYARHHRVRVTPHTRVERLDRHDGGWRLETTARPVLARQVLVTTGLLAEPHVPPALRPAPGEGPPVVHSSQYVDPVPYADRDVLVVGAGSSAMEIAQDLVRGGARRVLLSVRTPPNILPRAVAGMPGDPAVLLLLHVPPRLADASLAPLRRLVVGDLAPYGLPAPTEGPFTQLRRRGASPAVVDREVLDDIRAGRVEVGPAVLRLEPGAVVLSDGRRVHVDAVIAATGFRPGLEPLVGHLGVLDASGVPTVCDGEAALPGLRFVNFGIRPGLLLAARRRARRAVTAVAADLAVTPR